MKVTHCIEIIAGPISTILSIVHGAFQHRHIKYIDYTLFLLFVHGTDGLFYGTFWYPPFIFSRLKSPHKFRARFIDVNFSTFGTNVINKNIHPTRWLTLGTYLGRLLSVPYSSAKYLFLSAAYTSNGEMSIVCAHSHTHSPAHNRTAIYHFVNARITRQCCLYWLRSTVYTFTLSDSWFHWLPFIVHWYSPCALNRVTELTHFLPRFNNCPPLADL